MTSSANLLPFCHLIWFESFTRAKSSPGFPPMRGTAPMPSPAASSPFFPLLPPNPPSSRPTATSRLPPPSARPIPASWSGCTHRLDVARLSCGWKQLWSLLPRGPQLRSQKSFCVLRVSQASSSLPPTVVAGLSHLKQNFSSPEQSKIFNQYFLQRTSELEVVLSDVPPPYNSSCTVPGSSSAVKITLQFERVSLSSPSTLTSASASAFNNIPYTHIFHLYWAAGRSWRPTESPLSVSHHQQPPPACPRPRVQGNHCWKEFNDKCWEKKQQHLVTVRILPVVACCSLTPSPPILHMSSPGGSKTLQITCLSLSAIQSYITLSLHSSNNPTIHCLTSGSISTL